MIEGDYGRALISRVKGRKDFIRKADTEETCCEKYSTNTTQEKAKYEGKLTMMMKGLQKNIHAIYPTNPTHPNPVEGPSFQPTK